jgi:hypothetical protein
VGQGLVGTELNPASGYTYSGFVDVIHSQEGVRGWAVNLRRPLDPVRLELCVGDVVVAETLSDLEREDIAAKLGKPARAGFRFAQDVMSALSAHADDLDDIVHVRIAATGQSLVAAGGTPTIGEILDSMRAAHQPQAKRNVAELELLLDDLRAGAASLAELSLRPLPENLQGYVEALAVDSVGQVWFMGWMKKGHVQEFGALIVDRRKFPAAVAVMSYARDDLPPDCCGLVGLISSLWRPNSVTADMHMFFGPGGRHYLKTHTPLRIVSASELVADYEGIRDRCLGDGRAMVLQRMLTSLETWLPTRVVAQNYATQTAIDRILLVPGLGCLVEGWVMSPMKRIEGLRLRVGGAVMSADPDSLYWKPRPDLVAAFPGCEGMIGRAGFVGLFAGEAEPEDFADPVLKLIFQGGASSNFAIPPAVFRRLGHSAGLNDALRFFPSLQEEVFFPRFAAAAIRAERAAMNPPAPLSVARARRALVFVLPDDRCDLFLLFEELAQQCRLNAAEQGGVEAVAFIASSRSNRSDALWLFREFQSTHGVSCNIACSLLVIDDSSQAFPLLPEILREIGANRFFFADAGIFLTDAGWARARQALAPGASDLVFFGIVAEDFEHREAADGISARCFAWSAGHFCRWALTAPSFLGGFHHDNGLFAAKAVQIVHHNAARSSRNLLPSATMQAVNASVYAAATAKPVQGTAASMRGPA